ncbi:MAG TPA: alpha/beta hydrolase-fold protein [Longimicrobiales bacterium]|nr:alpha/beta hydrolase-fold protein [Longimicrobiales bacterium]
MIRSLLIPTTLIALACNGATGPAEPAPAGEGLVMWLAVPESTPADADVHVAGSFNAWNPGASAYRLTRAEDGGYTIGLPPSVRGSIQFKFTLGSWEQVETNSGGGEMPNRTYAVPAGGGTWSGTVAAWRDVGAPPERESTRTASVRVLSDAFAMPQLGRDRRVWLYLPPDYATSGDRRYPVLYMHDGQNLFDQATSYVGEWGVDETLDSLHAAGELSLIVVGVDHGGTRRFDEYSPWNNPQYGGGEGDEYVDFLVQTLKPYIDAHYRTLPDRLNTGVAGSSMGGLISFYAALRYPEIFSRAGVFSPAFWVVESEVMDWARDRSPTQLAQRLYFVSGALEGQGDAYARNQEQMADTLAVAGFVEGEHYAAHVRADGTHSEWFWRREFPPAVLWLFGAQD